MNPNKILNTQTHFFGESLDKDDALSETLQQISIFCGNEKCFNAVVGFRAA